MLPWIQHAEFRNCGVIDGLWFGAQQSVLCCGAERVVKCKRGVALREERSRAYPVAVSRTTRVSGRWRVLVA
ncbi:hypothetical protein NET03_10775 [Thermomicrobium sp. CFH 73360]|uniref:hypothetical protein n=1 Tax=Thermomicrobium sp. CFH 73360 TaxID=2951987 RepID=UPI0020779799|nr:hypothetical protein [Thermomicrobium sp. CFH 73360]MCM8747008.1 hypothetical protein [Thermomicrobium sp. CFH 73360]